MYILYCDVLSAFLVENPKANQIVAVVKRYFLYRAMPLLYGLGSLSLSVVPRQILVCETVSNASNVGALLN